MKHLKVSAKFIVGGYCSLIILEQTHFRHEFGPISDHYENWNISSFVHSNGIAIASVASSQWTPSYRGRWINLMEAGGKDVLYIPGNAGDVGRTTIELPARDWPRIREAVEAYNAWGATQT